MKSTHTKLALAAALMTTMLAGCATTGGGYYGSQPQYPSQSQPDNDNNRTQKGAVIGAVAGAVAGLLSGDDATERRQRALVGAGVGAIAAGAIGNYQDRQERALREKATQETALVVFHVVTEENPGRRRRVLPDVSQDRA